MGRIIRVSKSGLPKPLALTMSCLLTPNPPCPCNSIPARRSGSDQRSGSFGWLMLTGLQRGTGFITPMLFTWSARVRPQAPAAGFRNPSSVLRLGRRSSGCREPLVRSNLHAHRMRSRCDAWRGVQTRMRAYIPASVHLILDFAV